MNINSDLGSNGAKSFCSFVPTDEVRSLGKGKLKIRPIGFTRCVFFYSRIR